MEKEIKEEDYLLYDSIVSRTLEIIHPLIYTEPIIFLNYENNIINDYILKMCSIWSELTHKEIYVSSTILTYLILKVKHLKKSIKYKKNIPLESDVFCISPEKIVLQVCDEFSVNTSIIEKIFNEYYSKK